MAKPNLSKADADALLEEIRANWDYATEQWREIRQEADKDMLCIGGKVWDAMDPAGLQQRKGAGRPAIALDELGQYVNQVVNEVRANPRAIKFSPTGNGANDKTAEFYQNKTREIEYRSHAQMVYTTAFENAVQRSYGACRINTRRSSPRSFVQDIWLEPVVNPDLITPDPDHLRPDGSDMRYLFYAELWWTKDFQARWPDAQIKDFSGEMQTDYPAWMHGEKIQIAEYWKVKTKKRKLLQIASPQPGMPPMEVFEDELAERGIQPTGQTVLQSEEVEDQEVCQYLTNGVEILEVNPWAGKYIPFAMCYGKVIYVNEGTGAKKKILSMTRLARDPFMLYCYYRTAQAEVVGLTPKTPYMAYEGSLSPEQLTQIQKSLHEPVAVILSKPTVEGLPAGQVLPLPQRQPYTPEIAALELGAEAARRAIQAAMGGAPLPTSAQRKNEKSGVALKQIEESSQKGNFHFIDHYDDMIRHVGVMVEDLMDKVYDTAREVGIRKQDDTAAMMRINDPQTPDSVPTKGDHLVTVSTGPSYDSERDAASDFADNLIGSPLMQALEPPKAQKLIALAIKLKNVGPLGDEMADVISPPPNEDGKDMDPAQMAAQLQEAQQQLEALMQSAQAMKQALETEQAKQQAQIQKAQIDAEAGIKKAQIDAQRAFQIERLKASTSIAVARVQAAAKLDEAEQEAAIKLAVTELEQEHDAIQAELDRQHEVEMAEMQADRALIAAEHAAELEPKEQEGAGA